MSYDMYRTKKKKEVDPNAPPRPNLLSHDKVIRDQKAIIEQLERNMQVLTQKMHAVETKLQNQTAYLNHLHQVISSRK